MSEILQKLNKVIQCKITLDSLFSPDWIKYKGY